MRKSILAIVAFAAVMFTACNGSTKSGTDSDSIQCDSVITETAIDTDTLSSDVSAETDQPEASVQTEEKTAPEKTKNAEDVAGASQNAPSQPSANEGNASLAGIWLMQIADEYDANNKKVESSTTEKAVWEFTDKTVTVYSEDDLLDGQPLNYTLNGKRLSVTGLPFSFTITKLTETTLVLRSSVFNESYNIFTFKRE